MLTDLGGTFDEYFCNPNWRQDEFKAFQEAVTQYG